jgi:peptidoglycan/xylan/chitin deacetylase (PgdA/CDA1 family)
MIRKAVYLTVGTINQLIPNYRTRIFILCYHGIGEDDWTYSVNKATFKKQINYLISKKYNFISLSQVAQYLNGKFEISKPSVVITFDDGYKDILDIKNYIKKNNIKPTLFLLSDTKNANRKELENTREFLNKNEILSLVKNGWEIGSHTATHSDMHTLTDNKIKKEIINSKIDLENMLKIRVNYIAFPKGRYNKKILIAVSKAGYKLGLTMDDSKIDKQINPLALPRIGVDRTHSFQEFQTLFLPLVIKTRGLLKGLGYGK